MYGTRRSAKALYPSAHAFNPLLSEALQTAKNLIGCLLSIEVCLREKLVGITDDLPREPVALLLRHFFSILPFHPINIVKSLLLHALAGRNLRRHREALGGMERKLFLGVLFSGRFDYGKISRLLPALEAEADRRGWGLELLLHPGAVYEEEDIRALTNRSDHKFLTSPDRMLEAEALRRLGRKEASDA